MLARPQIEILGDTEKILTERVGGLAGAVHPSESRASRRPARAIGKGANVTDISVLVGSTPKPSLAAPRCSRALFRGLELFLLVGLVCVITIHHIRLVRGCTRLANMLFTPILTWYSHHVKGRLPIATPIATRAIRHLIHSLVRVQRRA